MLVKSNEWHADLSAVIRPDQRMNLVSLFGKNIRHYRLQKGMTQEQLAIKASMERGYVSELERGIRNPTVDALGRLAVALDVEPPKLLEPRAD